MSDIRVSVQWKSSAIFAGDNIECAITFRNVAPVRRRSPSPNAPLRGPGFSRERWKDTLPTHFTQRAPSNIPRQNSFTTVSTADIGGKDLAVSPAVSRASEATPLEHHGQAQREPSSKKESHRRSLSIVSIGNSIIEEIPTQVAPPRRPSNGHSRSASMQILPRRNGFPSPGPTSGDQPISMNWSRRLLKLMFSTRIRWSLHYAFADSAFHQVTLRGTQPIRHGAIKKPNQLTYSFLGTYEQQEKPL